MKILIIGSGGREHAIAKKLQKDNRQTKIYVLPGNGGISRSFECTQISIEDINSIVNFAVINHIDYVIPSTEAPLVMGIIDALNDVGIECFGPKSNAAIIEGSKWFSKEFMRRYAIPTADYVLFDEYNVAKSYLQQCTYPKVIKVDGLANGKGVYIVNNKQEAIDVLTSFMKDLQFGDAGKKIVVEEYLEGKEVSVQFFTDGSDFVCLPSSMDYKKVGENDAGLNTGGMGAIAPNPFYTEEIEQECIEKIIKPTLLGLKTEGRQYTGCMYIGLILTKSGPKVLEYNCRFGDPETEAILPLLDCSLLQLMLWTNGKLSKPDLKIKNEFSCCVVLASKGYPQKYQVGFNVKIPDEIYPYVDICGISLKHDSLVSGGGRVLAVTSVAKTLCLAIEQCYSRVNKLIFDNLIYRKDIGKL